MPGNTKGIRGRFTSFWNKNKHRAKGVLDTVQDVSGQIPLPHTQALSQAIETGKIFIEVLNVIKCLLENQQKLNL
jgi:hypothetical protein